MSNWLSRVVRNIKDIWEIFITLAVMFGITSFIIFLYALPWIFATTVVVCVLRFMGVL